MSTLVTLPESKYTPTQSSLPIFLPQPIHGFPATEQIPVIDDLHGTLITDNYRWLEEQSDKTDDWVNRQHAYTLSIIENLPHAAWLKRRFNELLRYDDSTVPSELIEGDRQFFWAKTKEQDKWVYFTKKNKDALPELLLDPNTWPEEKSLDITAHSRDGKYLAYGIAEKGNENPVVRIMDLNTGELLPDTLFGRKQRGISWQPHHVGFYYSAHPTEGSVPKGEEEYWNSVYYHKMGTSYTDDEKVFYSEDKNCYHAVRVTQDGLYEIFYRTKFSKCEVFFRSLGSHESLTPLATGFDGDYTIIVFKEQLYILTDVGAPMLQIFVTEISKPERANWVTLVPERKGSKIHGFVIIEGRLYVERLENAYTRLEIYDLDGTYLKDVPLPAIGKASVSGFQEARQGVKLHFSSFLQPSETFQYDFETDQLTSIHRTPIKVDTSHFETKQVWVTSKDGTKVSMFILHNKNIILNGKNPVLLTGYGGFNNSKVPGFGSFQICWLEAGGVYAIPNLRGGGEYGKEWHEGGMKEKKQNVFDDFIAAAEYLIEESYTSSQKLAIFGGSNGGLLVGAVMTQRPELFKTVLCQAPLLDMINYHKWKIGNIWETEYGTSDDPGAFRYLFKYSPYHNVIEGTHYPATLITTGDSDARVDPCHARKMAARLQAANASDKPILLYKQEASGHTGGTTLTQSIEHSSLRCAFLMDQLEMQIPDKPTLDVNLV